MVQKDSCTENQHVISNLEVLVHAESEYGPGFGGRGPGVPGQSRSVWSKEICARRIFVNFALGEVDRTDKDRAGSHGPK